MFKAITIILAACVFLTGCEAAEREKRRAEELRLQQQREAQYHQQTLAKIRAQAQIDAEAERGRQARKTAVAVEAERAKKWGEISEDFSRIAPYLAIVAGLVAFGYWLLHALSAADDRRVVRDETLEKDRMRYAAFQEALPLLPEQDRAAIVKRWIDGGGPPLLGHDGSPS